MKTIRMILAITAAALLISACRGHRPIVVEAAVDQSWSPHFSIYESKRCGVAEVTIIVPDVARNTRLTVLGEDSNGHKPLVIREGCRANFRAVYEPGSVNGSLWVLFEEEKPDGTPNHSPYVDHRGNEIRSIPLAAVSRYAVRKYDREHCTEANPCKYTVVHRLADGQKSPYADYDPDVIITQ